MFEGLKFLKVFYLKGNPLLNVNHNIFLDLHVILTLTDNFQICCAAKQVGSMCTAQPKWPTSCQQLLGIYFPENTTLHYFNFLFAS